MSEEKQIALDIGGLIDQPFDDFKNYVLNNKVPIGLISGVIFILEDAYATLRSRKDAILELVFTHKKTNEEVHPALECLYAEMTKIEQKVVFLKERRKELLKL